MDNFRQIDYSESQDFFRRAEITGCRLRIGDLNTSKWLQKESIKLDDIKNISRNYPDLRIFIIGEGDTEGFYIYSQKQKTCFKFEATLSEIK